MKILFVQKLGGISGSELYLLQILPELKKRGYDVSMLIIFPAPAIKAKPFIDALTDKGIPVFEIYGHGTISLALLKKINRVLVEGRYDIVQSNLIHADFWISLVRRLFNPPVKAISVVHGYEPYYLAKYGFDLLHLRSRPYYWIQRFAYRRIDYVVTISRALYTAFVQGGITSASKAELVYYGLTLKANPPDVNFRVPEGEFVAIVGRLTAFKGHSYLLDAWTQVVKKLPSLKLYIIGDGELKNELEQQAIRLGIQSNVVFTGHQSDPHQYIRNSLFTVVTSTWEGFGLILLESWLNKKAIVAFDAPAMNEVIEDKVNGLLAKARTPEDLAEKIIWLYQHPQLAAEFGENGYNKTMDYYNLGRMTGEMELVYQKVLTKN